MLYVYESPPGYGLLAMQFIAWIYFCYACFFTIKHHPEKAKFYTPFFFFYSTWYAGFSFKITVLFKGILQIRTQYDCNAGNNENGISWCFRFLIGPVFVLIAYFGFPKYQRARIVNGIELGISFLAQTYLLVSPCCLLDSI